MHLKEEDEMAWNEMKWNHAMLCHHVMSAWVVYGFATWPCPKLDVRRYVFTPMLSGFLAPCWYHLIQGFPHTASRWGMILRTRKMVLNVRCCFLRCCVVTWNMVLKCLWRCVACANIKPKEVSRRSGQFPLKTADNSKPLHQTLRLFDKKGW